MKAVGNSTPLTYFSRLGKFSLLTELFKEIVIPKEVYDEVAVKGQDLNKPETNIIQDFISKKYVEVKEIRSDLKIDTLHRGELAVISLASDLGIKNVLVDDREGVEVCKVLGLKPLRATALLMELLKRGSITIKEFEALLIELSKCGYFMRADAFEFLLREAERATKS